MAASANPSGNNHENSSVNGASAPQTNATANGNSENCGQVSGLMHIPVPGISTEWTLEEQATLEEGLNTYASLSPVMRYTKIALMLKNGKTTRDVAFRCRFMNKKEISKRRKDEPVKKSKDKREKVAEPSPKPSHMVSRLGGPNSVPNISIDIDDGISYKAIGGPTGRLLEQNAEVFQQIQSNFSCYRIQDNINFLCQVRDNIMKILNSLNDTPEIMKQMPPLPVKVNEELAKSILPQTSHSAPQ